MGLRVRQPMLASTQPPTTAADWAFEPKLDGWRALVYVDDKVTVRTRTGRDATTNLPQLQGLAQLGRRVVLDGELVADAGRARDFYRLGGRVRSDGATGDVTFVAFDVLVLDSDLICDWSYQRRRAALESLELVGSGWCRIRSLDAKPRELLEACVELDVEGVVAKRVDSPYRPGVRSGD
jgi:bifunctional non-homologous end joining protein LigD